MTTARSPVDVGAYLGDCRDAAVEEIRRFVPKGDALGPILYELVLDYPLRDAKGLRPALCIATSRALGGTEEGALPTAAVIELFHNAFLIHDDVEDGSERRRDAPALHREHGVPIAINVGDAMLALAFEPLLANTRIVGVGKALRIFEVIARMARETAEGQAMELDWVRRARWDLDDDDYRVMVVKKTAWYTFIAPVTLGAIIAGAPPERIDTLAAFARELGIAFQVRDDVLNLVGDEARYGKEALGDLWEGKRTVALLHMMRCASAAERARAMEILARPRPSTPADANAELLLSTLVAEGHLSAVGRTRLAMHYAGAGRRTKTEEDVTFLHDAMKSHGSIEYAERVASEHARRAHDILVGCTSWLAPSVHRDLLHALVDFTIGRDT